MDKENTEKKSFVFDAGSYFFANIAVFGFQFISGIIIARMLGPTGKGGLAILEILPGLLIMFGHFGIGNACTYYLGKKVYPLEKVAANALGFSVLFGLFYLFIGMLIFFFLQDGFFSDIGLWPFFVAVLPVPLMLFFKYAGYIFMGLQDVTSRNLILLLRTLSYVFMVAFFLLVFKTGIIGVLYAIAGSYLVVFLVSIGKIRTRAPLSIKMEKQVFSDSLKYGWRAYLALVVMGLNYKVDIVILKMFLDFESIGLYSQAVSLATKIWMLPAAIGMVTFSRISALDKEGANRLTPAVLRVTLLACVVFAVLAAAGSPLIPYIYGREFQQTVLLFLLLLPGIVSMVIYKIIHSDLAGRGRPEIAFYVFSVALILNVIMNFYLIPRIGVIAASISSTASYSLGSVLMMVIFRRISGVSYREMLVPTRADFARLSDSIRGLAR